MMREYEDDLDDNVGYDEYDEYDEYEGEGEEAEYEEQEEERKPTKEELEYLELRQRLKDSIRKKMKRSSGNSQSSQEKKNKLPYNDFGSFFGPSQPVISSRVIQESKSLLENKQLASRILNKSQPSKKPISGSSSGSKNISYEKRSMNEVKRKVEKLKDTRDYSFLFSEDADLPVSKKEPASSRSRPVPNSELRSAQLSAKLKQSLGSNGRDTHNAREEKRPASVTGQMHSRTSSSGSQSHLRPASSGSKMHTRPPSSGSQMHSRPGYSGSQMPSRVGGPSTHLSSQPNSKINPQKPVSARRPDSASVDHRRQMGHSNGVGPGRPVGPAKPMPSRPHVSPLERKGCVSGTKNYSQNGQKPSSSRMIPSEHRQRVEQRNIPHESSRSQMIPKRSLPPAKPQINKPVKRAPVRDIMEDRRPKKKPKMSEDDKALSMIRQMFKTDRYAGRGDVDDDSDMEANWEDIMREERRSARIAKEEDDEQLRLIEEEERRERMRKVKKQKLGH